MIADNFITDIIDEDNKTGVYDSRVQTRFPPEPNGYLHIGHAKSIVLNFSLAKRYGGICNLRFDDTNPIKEDTEYVDAIKEDISWLGFSWENLYYASDYFDKLYEYAVSLIKDGLAYVCDLTAEELKEYRGTLTEPGKNSPYRDRSVSENLQLFEDMKNGKYKDGEKVLRAKIDMAHPNMNMRDPAMYRIMHKEHHKTGNKWCIYPMYDYAHPVSDAIEGVTHSVCTLEFEAHRPVYEWFVNHLDFLAPPKQMEFARLNLTGTIMSKRYLKQLVDSNLVDGWDDPRMPTICGIRRRGFTPESIRDFCGRIGVAKANSEVDYAMLESCLRDDLGEKAPRAMAVINPLKVVITNMPEDELFEIELENNPNDESAGTRTLELTRELYIEKTDFEIDPPKKFHRLKPGGEVRLKGAYIIKCEDYKTDENGEVVEVYCTYDPATRSGECERKVKGTIHWLPCDYCYNAVVNEYSSLLLEGEGDLLSRINKDSLTVHNNVKVEKGLALSKGGDRFQFMRHGYFVRDTKNGGLVFNKIVGLRDTWAKMNKNNTEGK